MERIHKEVDGRLDRRHDLLLRKDTQTSYL